MELHQLLESVKDERSFLAFFQALREDRELDVAEETANPSNQYGPTSRGWANVTIESFLESAQAWAESSKFGSRQGLGAASPWRKFAEFLYCGKIYE